jgi:hypothetical protein
MELVKKLFVKDGTVHKLIGHYLVEGWANEKGSVGVGVYELSYEEGAVVGYSVIDFVKRINRFENDVPYVGLAGSGQWGIQGWSYYQKDTALKKFNERVRRFS